VGGAEGLSGELKLVPRTPLSNLALEPCTNYNKLVQSWRLRTIHSPDHGGIATRTKRRGMDHNSSGLSSISGGHRSLPATLESCDATFLAEKLVVKIKTID
jgi:hypothetical protein